MTSWNGQSTPSDTTRPQRGLPVQPQLRRTVGCLVVALIGIATPARAVDTSVDLGSQVLPIFDQKCGICHGPQAKKKEKFGYVTDLVQLAGNPKLIVPGNSAKSKVWTTIEEGDMPPSDDERAVKLTAAEMEIIKAWIDAGAPPEKTRIAGENPTTRSTAEATTNAIAPTGKGGGPSLPRRLVILVGKLHPLVAHFPIALLMAAGLAEAGWFMTRNVAFTGAVRFCTFFGGLGAIGTGALGWIRAAVPHYSTSTPSLLTTHRWLGTAAGIWAIPLILLCELGIRRSGLADRMSSWGGWSRTSFRLALFAGVTLIGLTAHLGGSLVYGEDYLTL